MTIALDTDPTAEARRARRVARAAGSPARSTTLGLGFLVAAGQGRRRRRPAGNLKSFARLLGIPLLAILLFLLAWAQLAPRVDTSLGALPGPAQVWEQAVVLHQDYRRETEKRAAFDERQEARNAELVAEGRADEVRSATTPASRPSTPRSGPRSGPCSSASPSPRSSRCRSASSAACRRR